MPLLTSTFPFLSFLSSHLSLANHTTRVYNWSLPDTQGEVPTKKLLLPHQRDFLQDTKLLSGIPHHTSSRRYRQETSPTLSLFYLSFSMHGCLLNRCRLLCAISAFALIFQCLPFLLLHVLCHHTFWGHHLSTLLCSPLFFFSIESIFPISSHRNILFILPNDLISFSASSSPYWFYLDIVTFTICHLCMACKSNWRCKIPPWRRMGQGYSTMDNLSSAFRLSP